MRSPASRSLTVRALWRRVAAWSAVLAISLGVALPTLAQTLGDPRAAWSELCSTRGGDAAARLAEPTGEVAVLAHLFQHCGDCLSAFGGDGAPALPAADFPTTLATGADLAPALHPPAAPAAAIDWPAPPARAPPTAL